MSKIKIKNFGPIKEGLLENDGWIDIKKVTVFIGNQGSGKSTVAKLISTMTWIEKALVRGDLNEKYISSYNRFIKYNCTYQNIQSYFKDDTEIHYQGKKYSLHYSEGKFSAHEMLDLSDGFTIHPYITIAKSEKYQLPKIMYVPAERNFASASQGATAVKGLPHTLYTFIDEFNNAINEMKGELKLPINNVKFEYNKSNKISSIIGEDYKIRLSESSSGFQSFVPLFIVSQYLASSINKESDGIKKELSIDEENRIKKEVNAILSNSNLSEEVRKAALENLTSRFKPSCFVNIVEEPEQNLFPSSQQKMLYSLLEFNNMNEGNKLIMTTHSPYLLVYLTLCVEANNLKEKIKNSKSIAKLSYDFGIGSEEDNLFGRLYKIVPEHSIINGNDLVVYQLDETNGTIEKLKNYKGLPSDENELNNLLADANDDFSKLLDLEDLCQ